MISLQEEKASEILEELKPLLLAQWDEQIFNLGACNPDWEVYVRANDSGYLKVFTARKDGILKGYAIFWLRFSLQQKTTLCACSDVICIDKKLRGGRDMLGFKLFIFAQAQLKKHNVNRIYIEGMDGISNSLLNLVKNQGFSSLSWVVSKDI